MDGVGGILQVYCPVTFVSPAYSQEGDTVVSSAFSGEFQKGVVQGELAVAAVGNGAHDRCLQVLFCHCR